MSRILMVLGSVVLGILLNLSFSSNLMANVSLKNGNFFVAYTDIIYPGGFEPKIERVYNSKTNFKGMFGYGWGNEYEVYLTVSADGSVVVHEYGGGAENRFSPVAFKAAELDKAIASIVDVARKLGVAGTAAELASYQQKLKTDAEFRNDQWEKFRAQGKLEARKIPDGTQLQSNRFSYQYITKVKDGYVRNFDTGKVEKFNEAGRLARISDKNGNFIEISYGNDGHIQKVIDNFNRKMFFTFNDKGLLAKIDGANEKIAEYQYNGALELISSRDVDGNVYKYKYDSQNYHNMIEISYSDSTTMQMAYWGNDKHLNIKRVKERDNNVTEYDYETDSSDRGHTSASVVVKGADDKAISTSKYEYFLKYKPDGEEWTYKMNTTLDGDQTETTYNECCGLPLVIKHGKDETTFEYDVKGHVTKKTTPAEVTTLAYDAKAGKVSKVSKFSKVNPQSSSWSTFQYDARANLVFAKNSEGKGVKLLYDSNGRIRTLIDQNKRQITFKYNENSKPVEITDPSLGTISVTYSNSGEIKKVDSTAGRKIALQVTSAFQNLLDIIRPAGVTLAF